MMEESGCRAATTWHILSAVSLPEGSRGVLGAQNTPPQFDSGITSSAPTAVLRSRSTDGTCISSESISQMSSSS
eukprot:CAMPEP_0182611610 /NCGR_PEP_ID=MMETSP1330-20130603/14790_1 /TAXON_ID=464278 /ORGANISM="Picochlorum sp., Strain RCC944" /LENGTH=73 /DNA_ID=CAMNT_0024831033 /DNA_START=220 /DNA_END=441 /DNA_ORIENTATION=+